MLRPRRRSSALYNPVMTASLFLGLLGFRTTSRVILATMGGSALMVVGLLAKTTISNRAIILIGMVVNMGRAIFLHYALGEAGGWIKGAPSF